MPAQSLGARRRPYVVLPRQAFFLDGAKPRRVVAHARHRSLHVGVVRRTPVPAAHVADDGRVRRRAKVIGPHPFRFILERGYRRMGSVGTGYKPNGAVFYGEIYHGEVDYDEGRRDVPEGDPPLGIVENVVIPIGVQMLDLRAGQGVVAARACAGVVVATPDRVDDGQDSRQVDQDAPLPVVQLTSERMTREPPVHFFAPEFAFLLLHYAFGARPVQGELFLVHGVRHTDEPVPVKYSNGALNINRFDYLGL